MYDVPVPQACQGLASDDFILAHGAFPKN